MKGSITSKNFNLLKVGLDQSLLIIFTVVFFLAKGASWNLKVGEGSIKGLRASSHKEELFDFKCNQHFIYFQTKQFCNTVVTHQWIDINCIFR